jgi:branched-chain amino acid transport system substrate-binding protein
VTRRLPLAALVTCLLLSGCSGVPFVGGNGGGPVGLHQPIKVALVDVFGGSSPYAAQGAYLQNSLQVEIDALNAAGGLLGSQVQLVTADDQLDPVKTAAVVKQLLADRAVRLLVGPSFAAMYLPAKPLIDRAQMPNCLTNMAADDLMTGAPYSFRAQAQDAASVPSLLGYVQHGTQIKKMGLIDLSDGVGQGHDAQLSDQAPRFGVQYAGAAFVAPGADQKTQVQQMLKLNADAIVLSADPATAARTLQTIAGLKATAKVRTLGFGGLGAYAFPATAGDPANGVTFTGTIETYLSDVPEARWPPAYHDFVKTAQTRFGTAANGVEMKAVPAAADCIVEWSRAAQAAGSLDGAQVVKAWSRLDVPAAQSVLGVRERFRADDHDAIPPDGLGIYQWFKNGDHWSLKQLLGPTA